MALSTNAFTAPTWHAELWTHMARAVREDRVAHALLICGAPGVGKRMFAERIVTALLCRTPDDNGDGCGQCPPCRQYAAGTHPDISRLQPEEAGKMIKVDQVRAFGHALTLTPQYDSGRIGWIDPAEQLTISAANSLLKTLEEPPQGTHIVLVSDRVSALMATIRSRCQQWRVPPARPGAARAWLEQNQVEIAGVDRDSLRTPLALIGRQQRDYPELVSAWDGDLIGILSGRADAVNVAERVAGQPADLWLDWLYRRADALLALSIDGEGAPPRDTLSDALARQATTIDAGRFARWCARLADSARLVHTNADWRLVVESLLLHLEQSISRG